MPSLALPILTLVLVLVVALLGVWSFGSGLDQRHQLASRHPVAEAQRHARKPMNRLNAAVLRTGVGQYVGRRLAAAGMRMRVATFLVLLVGACLVGVVIAWNELAPVFGVLAIVVVGWAFFQFLRHNEDRRKEEFVGQLPELARVLSNAFSAGLALRTALEIAAEELADPARTELRITADSLKLGQSTEQALIELGNRLPSRELSVLVSTLVISSRSGGSMVTALRNIAGTLESRKEVRREIKTTLAQAVYTGYLIALMGIAELFIINATVPDSLRRMTGSPIGVVCLLVSGTLFVLGVVAVFRMSKVDL